MLLEFNLPQAVVPVPKAEFDAIVGHADGVIHNLKTDRFLAHRDVVFRLRAAVCVPVRKKQEGDVAGGVVGFKIRIDGGLDYFVGPHTPGEMK